MTDTVIEASINDLLDLCSSGTKGYRQASEVVTDDTLKEILMRYSKQRENYRKQLVESILLPLGIERENINEQEVLGAVHRGWIAFQSIFDVDVHVLHACELAEYVTLGVYERVLDEVQDPTYQEIISSQKDGIQRSWEHMRELQVLHR